MDDDVQARFQFKVGQVVRFRSSGSVGHRYTVVLLLDAYGPAVTGLSCSRCYSLVGENGMKPLVLEVEIEAVP
jgi:hypothetical protein